MSPNYVLLLAFLVNVGDLFFYLDPKRPCWLRYVLQSVGFYLLDWDFVLFLLVDVDVDS